MDGASFRHIGEFAQNLLPQLYADEFADGRAPAKVVLHFPWFMDVSSVSVDGKRVTSRNKQIEIEPTTQSIHSIWRGRPIRSDMPSSYTSDVESYEVEYAKRYRALVAGIICASGHHPVSMDRYGKDAA